MKKLFIAFAFLFSFSLFNTANADVMPYYVNNINTNSIGVYQASNNIKIYKNPNENSPLLLNVFWDAKTYSCAEVSASNLFVVFLPKKELAFLTVIDENDNEDWLQVVYTKNGVQMGWVKKEEEYRFMSWRTFFNLYGRKYGLYYLKDAPDDTRTIYGSNADDAQEIGKINKTAQSVNLNSVRGNWLLVNAFDMDKLSKIGWIKWRSTSGEIYLFPDIK